MHLIKFDFLSMPTMKIKVGDALEWMGAALY